ncbi:MAG: hypothetical protein AB7Q69_05815 [Gemmatimonadales bacterium]
MALAAGTELGEFAMYLAVGLASLGLFFGPIGRGLGRWIESRVRPGSGDERERTEVLEGRLQELEERLDFTERLLAQERERLPDVNTPV